MYVTRSDYDRGVNTFNPEGRLFQVEYAIAAINLGSTAIGIQTAEGIVLAAERRVKSPLLLPSSIQKLAEIDSHVACAMSGLTGDARTLIDHARVDAQNYRFTYDEPISVESLTQSICDLALRFGEDRNDENAMSRPFGVALLMGGWDGNTPVLFHTDPSGTFLQYAAKAIGSGSEGAQTQLELEYHKSMTLEEAQKLALQVLKAVMEEKLEPSTVEVGIIGPDKQYRLLPSQRVEELILLLKPKDGEGEI